MTIQKAIESNCEATHPGKIFLKLISRRPIQFFAWSIFSILLGYGQITEGRVLDAETKQPLSNVNVFIENTEIGTATNNKGEFELRYTNVQTSDSLVFSIIGYQTRKIRFKNLNGKTSPTILMQERTSELGEVIISEKKKLREKLRYNKLSSMKKGVYAFDCTVVNDTIYVIGGSESFVEDTMRKAIDDANTNCPDCGFLAVLDELEPNASYQGYNNNLLAYDINLDQWHTKKTEFIDRENHQVNLYKNRLYAIGGKKISNNGKKEYLHNKIEILDLDSLSVITDDTNPHQAIDFASFIYKDNILVMGGAIKKNRSGKKIFTDKCRVFQISTGYWYELENMTKAKQTDGAIINEKVYLIGGSDGKPLSEIESLDLSDGKWRKEGYLPYAMESPSIASNKEIIYIYNFGKLLVYNTKANTIYEYDLDLTIKEPSMVYDKNKLYIIGGYIEEQYARTPSSEVFSIDLVELNKTRVINSKKLSQL